VLRVYEPHIGFVDERGGWEAVVGPFTAEAAAGNPLEFLVHKWRETGERRLVSCPPGQ